MRRVLVDASAFITLAAIDRSDLLRGLEGRVEMPAGVRAEVIDDPAASRLKRATAGETGWLRTPDEPAAETLEAAATQLGEVPTPPRGDVDLLAHALAADETVVVTDDRPLRKTCKALGIPVSGSIGVHVVAVERRELDPDAAKDALLAMDEVGARLSASLLRRAERLIDEAADRDRA